MANEVVFEILCADTINYAMQQNHVQPIHRLRIRNTSGQELKNLMLEVTSDPGFIMPFHLEIPSLKAREKRNIDISLSQVPSLLFAQTESVRGTLNVTLYQEERTVEEFHKEITILAYDEWQGLDIMPEVTASFVTPNHPYISELIKRSTSALRRLARGSIFDGYASGSTADTRRQAEAIYNTISGEGLTYQLPPAGFGPGQRLRLADTVSESRCGTCIDLSLLMAGCFEAVRLNPLLIFTESHAFVGVWLISDTFSECVQEDISALSKRNSEEVGEILLIETTALTRGASFAEACSLGSGHLADALHFRYAIDVRRARLSGVNPISIRRYDRKGNLLSPDDGTRPASKKRGKTTEPSADEIFRTKQQMWERKLLDLTMRNTLVNFKSTRSSVQFLTKDCTSLVNALFAGGDYTLVSRPEELGDDLIRTGGLYLSPKTVPDKLLRAELDQKRLCTYQEEKELANALTNLYRSARTSVEESGANPLYLAVGFLRWYENERSSKECYAPLVLLPVELARRTSPRGFVMRLRDEEPQFNITLLELLRNNFGLNITGLDPLPKTEDSIDLGTVFHTLERSLSANKRWEILEVAALSNFSFSKFIMWNDLHNRSEELGASRMVNALVHGYSDRHDAPLFLSPNELDEQVLPADVAAPLPCDSSQLAAIHAAAQGASFVLHGPPGTGKSQTIANMICNALYSGKSVLFIAEKMAALNVVQKRLDALGLSPFCLELHSDKAKKTDVLNHLSETLDNVRATSPKDYADESVRLLGLRRALGETMSLIHCTRECGFSLYEMIARFEQYREAKESDFFTEDYCRTMSPALWRAWEGLIREYITLGTACGGVHDNPLSIYSKAGYMQSDKPALADALENYARYSDAMQKAFDAMRKILPVGKKLSFAQMGAVNALCARLAEITALPAGILTSDALASGQERIARLCDVGRKHIQLREVLLYRFNESFLDADVTSALRDLQNAKTSSLFVRRGRVKKERDRLAEYAKDPESVTVRDLDDVWQMLRDYKESAETIRDLLPAGKALFGDLLRGEDTDFVYLSRLYRDASDLLALTREVSAKPEEVKNLLVAIDRLVSRGDIARKADDLRRFCLVFEQLTRAEEKVSDVTETDVEIWRKADDWHGTERERFTRAAANIDALRDYCTYRTKRQEMQNEGLGALVDLAENGEVALEDLMPVFYRGASLALASYIIEQDKRLSAFTGVMMEERIRDYTDTCNKFSRLTVEELLARLCARIPHADGGADSSEMSILRRAARSGGRGMSLRRLFDSIPHLLRRLAPCMLMSPLSVAQYLDPALPPFDLVIFDEASQMPTCEAVGAIARAEHLVVVGDPKQLPPTTFFNTLHYDEDNLEREDLDSLLDDCLALSMPELHLLWHYRSRHESLIAFSNNQYYDGKLFTFPSPSNQVSRVSYVSIDGIYDRGRTKQNRAEAEAIVNEVVRRLRDPALKQRSIGVVTFSSTQQLLIEDLLEAKLARNPDAEAAAMALHEPIFVKNLENVQGDERDVILFSVCYGPDRTGHVGVNFGPLNRDGGWRRLNVAVSRARDEMMVFTSLAPEQIDLDRTHSLGVTGLRTFLEYARDGREAIPNGSEDTPYDIADCIADILRKRGYTCHTHVGNAAGRIDVAVCDSRTEGEYLLGILCDTPYTGEEETVRDRNILRGNVFTELGWQIHRVWSVDFWDAPAREIEKIVKAIDRARRHARRGTAEPAVATAAETAPAKKAKKPVAPKKTTKKATATEPTEEAPRETEFPAASTAEIPATEPADRRTYTVTKLKEVPEELRNLDGFLSDDNYKTILAQVREVLATETPISYTLLRRRLTDAWGIRANAKVDTHLAAVLGETRSVTREDGDKVFYWGIGQIPEEFRIHRAPAKAAEKRDGSDIPKEEFAAALGAIVEGQLSLSREDACKLTAQFFGHTKPTDTLLARIDASVAIAIGNHTVTEQNGQLISPNA